MAKAKTDTEQAAAERPQDSPDYKDAGMQQAADLNEQQPAAVEE